MRGSVPDRAQRRFGDDRGSHGLEQSQERCALAGRLVGRRLRLRVDDLPGEPLERAARSEWFVSVSGTPEFIAADTTL